MVQVPPCAFAQFVLLEIDAEVGVQMRLYKRWKPVCSNGIAANLRKFT